MKCFLFPLLCSLLLSCAQGQPTQKNNVISYCALGDSYTICEGAGANESWPVILSKHLTDAGIKTDLVANPSRTGWTTQDLIDHELPVFDRSAADFVTLCIGVNDWVQGVDSGAFHKNLVYILDHVQNKLKHKGQLILITIPDFSVTPTGAKYAFGRDVPKGISEFNSIIVYEAKKRNLRTVDLFEVSRAMKDDRSLVALDGLHPSAKEYAIWETLILPVAKEILKK
ncbi:MAG TPA: SGNH/GDSL hydrolase family protein [Bacteroidia bacterium]